MRSRYAKEVRKSFHQQLTEAEGLVVETAGLVLKQLELTLKALERHDEAVAQEVLDQEAAIDERYVDIEKRILTLLATQAPVASDLRLVSGMLHINMHLERMGALCGNIAKFVKLAIDLPTSEDILRELVEMGQQDARMLDTAIRAFANRDLNLALGLPRMDDPIDRLNRRIFKEVARYADETMVEWAARMALVSRQLERMGDHAVDIGEQVAFMITGDFRQFTDASAKGNV